ncbi:MAG: CotH kinase family protein, partial [Verrucomicrobiota bacterium]
AFWKSVYEDHHVLQIDIVLTGEAWEAMQPKQAAGGRGRRPENEYTYVKADLMIDGEPFKDAGLRFKGNSSYRFSARSLKRPLKIDTNRFVKGQKLHGRTKLNLSNAYLDPSFMKEKLAYELYGAAGLPTPGTGWAAITLTVEGVTEKKHLGVYVVIEQVDRKFLARHFGKTNQDSLLMKPEISQDWSYPGDAPEDYEAFEIKEGEENKDQIRRFGSLLKLIHEGSDEDFAKEIGDRMDLNQLAGYLAATSLLSSIDSYIGMPHNYYLFMDKKADCLRLLPWDVNEAFGTFTMGSSPETLVDWDIDQPWVSKIRLLERLFATESFPVVYKDALSNLMKGPFTEEKLAVRMAAFEKAIAEHVENGEVGEGVAGLRMGIEGDADGYNTAVERKIYAIKPFIRKRIASIKAQLAGKREGEKFEMRGRRGGRAPGGRRGGPGGWRPEGRGPRPLRGRPPG